MQIDGLSWGNPQSLLIIEHCHSIQFNTHSHLRGLVIVFRFWFTCIDECYSSQLLKKLGFINCKFHLAFVGVFFASCGAYERTHKISFAFPIDVLKQVLYFIPIPSHNSCRM
eukprot:TRINITY_DN33971_c0_g1_i9.p1 TRINITY_DN33971_c0_g1~~TRINITY_DN33971_c0_g1_i9.p1  ORF type:complete len:112 (+),score=3.59 TRINITY_DN33971_c0_g1_i9:781-1116(+)